MNVTVRIGQTKHHTAEIGRFDRHRQQRKRLFQNRIDHRLIVLNAVIDNIVKIVIVFDIHAVEIVSIRVIRKLLNAADGLDSGEIQSKNASKANTTTARIANKAINIRFFALFIFFLLFSSILFCN